ncbi:hypothetical protein [Tabrizicola sp.]|uniref:hypothetical protein n=1 Tax=Tabrizicola sp. TaxID=2005166 RepID=UPI002FDD0CD5
MRIVTALLVSGLALAAAPARAATPETEVFGQCLIGKTTGDDRLLLARWITFAFASHPIVQDTVSMDAAKLVETDRGMANLVMSLLTERCSAEAKAAVAAEGNAAVAMQKAFEMLGMVASQEVMMDAAVQARINGFAGYLDEGRLNSALTP